MKKILVAAAIAAAACGCVSVNQNDGGNACRRPCIAKDIVHEKFTVADKPVTAQDNTLVKIADAAGNVFFQGRSEGGLITWDGCNAAGDRVKTGVYYVFASSGTSDQSGDTPQTRYTDQQSI